jgi:DNA recombination protein RmuC
MLEPYWWAVLALASLLVTLNLVLLLGQARLQERTARLDARLEDQQHAADTALRALADTREMLERRLGEDRERIEAALSRQREAFDRRQLQALRTMHRSMQTGMSDVRGQVSEALLQNADLVGQRVEGLTAIVDRRLGDIGNTMEKRLSDGLERTQATFADIVTRLALIDEAQKRIAELSSNVVSLQEILVDKRSRGAFGEVQLNALVRDTLPEPAYRFQHTLSNGNRADCILFLPPPTGPVVIDAKFPLESYQAMTDPDAGEPERRASERQFKTDIRKHIRDISGKYLVPGETADGAVMFVPAEAVFAEIHAHHGDLVEMANRAHVWLASPTTLMAILTTARAVLKDEATRTQVHQIRNHLDLLREDFGRFQKRMDNLSRHIDQANRDVQEVHASARKITQHFDRIEQVDLDDIEDADATLTDASPPSGRLV